MDSKTLLNEMYNDPKISTYLGLFKTSKWRNLKKNEKIKVYTKLHEYLCSKYSLYKDILVVDDEHMNDNIKKDQKIYNVVNMEDGTLYIQDIFYNQYLTLFEYFYVVMQKYQKMACETKQLLFPKKKMWKESLKEYKFGEAEIRYFIERNEDYSSYQDINADALKFAREMVFKVVKNNFEYEDSYDEQFFMTNGYVLLNDRLIQDGQDKVYLSKLEKENSEQKMRIIENKMLSVIEDCSSANDEDLFLAVYPNVISSFNENYRRLIDVYNEIIKRIYKEDLQIKISKNYLKINGTFYKFHKFFDNAFNIIVLECMKHMDTELRNDLSLLDQNVVKRDGVEEAIIDYKKKWFYGVIFHIDKNLLNHDFDVIRYQPLYRLVNKENLKKNIQKTSRINRGRC